MALTARPLDIVEKLLKIAERYEGLAVQREAGRGIRDGLARVSMELRAMALTAHPIGAAASLVRMAERFEAVSAAALGIASHD